MLTAEQRKAFDESGVVRLPRAVDPRVVGALRDEILAWIAQRGLAPEAKPHCHAIMPSKLARVANAHGFEEIWGAAVLAVIDEILGPGEWLLPKTAGQLLAMPWPTSAVTWELPHGSWHLDYRAPGAARALPGLQLFLCVDRIESRSAATLVAAGTPRLIDGIRRRAGDSWPGSSSEVRKALRREVPWFRELSSVRPGEDRVMRFMSHSTEFSGGSLQVVELVGEPGDVWLMHPWMVHAGSSNCGTRPRMALTERIRTPEGCAS
jgi:hypothetical protein